MNGTSPGQLLAAITTRCPAVLSSRRRRSFFFHFVERLAQSFPKEKKKKEPPSSLRPFHADPFETTLPSLVSRTLRPHPRTCAFTVFGLFPPLTPPTHLFSPPPTTHFCVFPCCFCSPVLFCPSVKKKPLFLPPQAKEDDGLGGKLPQHGRAQDTPRLVFNTNSDVLVRTHQPFNTR